MLCSKNGTVYFPFFIAIVALYKAHEIMDSWNIYENQLNLVQWPETHLKGFADCRPVGRLAVDTAKGER